MPCFPRFRFRLTTLLVVVTAICVWLGMISHTARQQEEAVAVVNRLNGRCAFDYHYSDPADIDGPLDLDRPPTAPAWARRLFGEDYFRKLLVAGLGTKEPVSADDVRTICGGKNLRHLSLLGARLADIDLKPVAALPRLEKLDLGYTNITDDSLLPLARLRRLTYLSLRDTSIGNAGLNHLRPLRSLVRLDLDGTQISSDGLASLVEMTSLEEISLSETLVDERAVDYLRQIKRLRRLNIWGTGITEHGVSQLHECLPNCTVHWDADHVRRVEIYKIN